MSDERGSESGSHNVPSTTAWTHVTAKTLYGGTFIERAASIRALIFGEMVRIAENKVESFRSDLFHDAVWLNTWVTGPGSFEWVARTTGTHIGDPDYIKKVLDIFGDEPLLRFRFHVILDGDFTWKVVVSQAAPIKVPDSVKTTDVYPSLAKPVADVLQENVEEASKILSTMDDDSDGTFTEDDRGNWHLVASVNISPTPVTVKKTTKERGTMDSILSELRSKVENAENEKNAIDENISNIESTKESLESAAEELDSFINEMTELINSLENMPEVSIYVDSIEIDQISFDSND